MGWLRNLILHLRRGPTFHKPLDSGRNRVRDTRPWQERVVATQAPQAQRISVSVPTGNMDWLVPKSAADLIAHAVRNSGLSSGRDEDIAFYLAAHRSGSLNGRDIRKKGALLTKEQKREIGFVYRGMYSRELYDTLNEAGRADPVDSAWTICSYANGLMHSQGQLKSAADAGIEMIRFRASNMAAGPCAKAKSLDEARLPIGQVEIVPFDQCTHPGQCACMFQSWIPLLDEIE